MHGSKDEFRNSLYLLVVLVMKCPPILYVDFRHICDSNMLNEQIVNLHKETRDEQVIDLIKFLYKFSLFFKFHLIHYVICVRH